MNAETPRLLRRAILIASIFLMVGFDVPGPFCWNSADDLDCASDDDCADEDYCHPVDGFCKLDNESCSGEDDLCPNGDCLSLERFSSDENHCGGCGQSCASEQLCCGGRCIDTETDRFACGDCTIQCADTEHCEDSICVSPQCRENAHCPTGLICVNERCDQCDLLNPGDDNCEADQHCVVIFFESASPICIDGAEPDSLSEGETCFSSNVQDPCEAGLACIQTVCRRYCDLQNPDSTICFRGQCSPFDEFHAVAEDPNIGVCVSGSSFID